MIVLFRRLFVIYNLILKYSNEQISTTFFNSGDFMSDNMKNFRRVLITIGGCCLLSCNAFKSPEPKQYKKIEVLCSDASRAVNRNDFLTAIQKYTDAMLEPDCDSKKNNELQLKLANTFLAWSRFLYWQAREERSASKCREALMMAVRAAWASDEKKNESNEVIDKLFKELLNLEDGRASDIIKFKADIKFKELELNRLCKMGNIFIESSSFEEAVDSFRDALLVDPYYPDAVKGLKKAAALRELDEAKARNKRLLNVEVENAYKEILKEKQIHKVPVKIKKEK